MTHDYESVLLDYNEALIQSRNALAKLIDTEPGTEDAAKLADRLAQTVTVIACNAQVLLRSRNR